MHHRLKNGIKTLPLEAETAISYLPIQEQEFVRHQKGKNIYTLYN